MENDEIQNQIKIDMNEVEPVQKRCEVHDFITEKDPENPERTYTTCRKCGWGILA